MLDDRCDYSLNEFSFKRGFEDVFGYYNEHLCNRLFYIISRDCNRYQLDKTKGMNFYDFVTGMGSLLFDKLNDVPSSQKVFEIYDCDNGGIIGAGDINEFRKNTPIDSPLGLEIYKLQ